MKINKENIVLSVLCLLIFANFANAEEKADKPLKIAITSRMNQNGGEALKFQDIFQDGFLNALSGNEGVILLERKDVDKIISEQKLSAPNIEPIVLGRLLGVDLFVCLSLEKSEGKQFLEVAVLDVDSANVVYTLKEEIDDDLNAVVQKMSNIIIKRLPKIKSSLLRDKDKTSASVLSVYNRSPSDRFDYLEGVLTEKVEDTISFFEGFRVLRRNYVDIARSETDLSYAGWVRPSDKAIAQYSDVAVSIEFKEVNKSGVEFKKTPIEIIVTLVGKKVDTQNFKIVDSIDNLTEIFNKLKGELKKRVGSLKKSKDNPVDVSRKKETDRLWKTFEKMDKRHELDNISWKNGEYNEIAKRAIDILEKIVFLDPSLKQPRFELGMIYSRLFGGLRMEKPFEKRVFYFEKVISDWEFLLTQPPECSEKEYRLYAYFLGNTYYWYRFMLERKDKAKYSDKILELQKKHYLLYRNAVLRIPPEELQHGFFTRGPGDYFLNPKINDVKGAVEWFLYLDKIVGKKYFQKHPGNLWSGNCPIAIATIDFAKNKHIKEAEYFLELCRKTQPEMYEKYGKELEHSVYSNKGDKKKVQEIREAYREDSRNHASSADFASELMTCPVKLPMIKIPDQLFTYTDYLPRNGCFLFLSRNSDTELYGVGIGGGRYYGGNPKKAGMFEATYNKYLISETDSKGNVIKQVPMVKKDGKPVRITDCVYDVKNIYYATSKGLMCYNRETKEEKWFTTKEGLPYNYISRVLKDEDKLWLCTGHFYEKDYIKRSDYSLFSFNPQNSNIKTYLSKKKYNAQAILDLKKYKSGFIVTCGYHIFFVDINTGKWNELKGINTASIPVKHNNEIWVGTNKGLGKISDKGFQKVFSNASRKEISSFFDNTRNLAISIDTPIASKITALASDRNLLWIVSEQRSPESTKFTVPPACRLSAYDTEADTWYGPFKLPGRVMDMDINKNGYLLFHGDFKGMLKTDNLIKLARDNKLVRTTAEYKQMVNKKFQATGPYAQSIYAIMTRQPKDKTVELLNKAIKQNPEDPRALFWKGIYLGDRTIPEKKEAIGIYDDILSSKFPKPIKNVAETEKERIGYKLKKALERQKRKQSRKRK